MTAARDDRAELGPDKRQAPPTAAFYLRESVAAIDAELGEGYAAAHPQLVAAMVQACAIERAVNSGRVSVRDVCEALVSLKPRLF